MVEKTISMYQQQQRPTWRNTNPFEYSWRKYGFGRPRPAESPAPLQKRNNRIYGVIIKCTSTNRYILVQGRYTGKWSFPKGHSYRDESPMECARREVMEETGMEIDKAALCKTYPLHVGKYFMMNIETETPLSPLDNGEIMNVGWFSMAEAMTMCVNVDVSVFMKRFGADYIV